MTKISLESIGDTIATHPKMLAQFNEVGDLQYKTEISNFFTCVTQRSSLGSVVVNFRGRLRLNQRQSPLKSPSKQKDEPEPTDRHAHNTKIVQKETVQRPALLVNRRLVNEPFVDRRDLGLVERIIYSADTTTLAAECSKAVLDTLDTVDLGNIRSDRTPSTSRLQHHSDLIKVSILNSHKVVVKSNCISDPSVRSVNERCLFWTSLKVFVINEWQHMSLLISEPN